jgi:hypothetical protein
MVIIFRRPLDLFTGFLGGLAICQLHTNAANSVRSSSHHELASSRRVNNQLDAGGGVESLITNGVPPLVF